MEDKLYSGWSWLIERMHSCQSLFFKLRLPSSPIELLTTPKNHGGDTKLLSVSNMASSWGLPDSICCPEWWDAGKGMLEGYLSWAPASRRESLFPDRSEAGLQLPFQAPHPPPHRCQAQNLPQTRTCSWRELGADIGLLSTRKTQETHCFIISALDHQYKNIEYRRSIGLLIFRMYK